MAKWNSYPQLTASQLDGADLVPISDESEADTEKSKTASLDALRAFLGAGITEAVQQAAHGLSVGDVVRFDGAEYVRATADTAANSEAVGVVTAAETDAFAFQTAGVVSTLSGLTPGELYYLQDDGSLGTSAGTVEKPVLIATSATSAVLILAISGTSGGGGGGAVDWGDIGGTLSDQTDLQAALNARLNKLAEVNSYSGNRTLDSDDSGAYVRITAAGTVTLPDGLDTGFQCVIVNATDAATVELAAATTLTLPVGYEPEIQNRRAVTVVHVGSNVWEAHGALVEES